MTAKLNSRKKRRSWPYKINGLLIIAPVYFLYTALNPEFPDEWAEKPVGPVTVTPRPADLNPPYPHEGQLQKDFSLKFCTGCSDQFSTAHLSVGARPAPMNAHLDGIIHGHGDNLHVHAPYPHILRPNDRLWLTLKTWDGKTYHTDWPIPPY